MDTSHRHTHNSEKNIKIAFILNLIFTIAEITGGLWTNSMAILSDALHDFGDSLSLGLSWFLEKYAKKNPDKYYSFGYARFSLLGALINSFILIIGSIYIFSETIPRIFDPETVHPKGMFVFAIAGIIINGLAVIRLKTGQSMNEKVVSWHLLEDVLGWVAVLIVSTVLLFKDIPILDPLLSIGITLYVLTNVVKNIKDILRVFLQGVPTGISIDDIEKKVTQIQDIQSVHHTHIWSLEGENNLLSTHVVVKDGISKEKIIAVKSKVKSLMKKEKISHVTVEIEFESEGCKEKEEVNI